jgi:hypothetical protein
MERIGELLSEKRYRSRPARLPERRTINRWWRQARMSDFSLSQDAPAGNAVIDSLANFYTSD